MLEKKLHELEATLNQARHELMEANGNLAQLNSFDTNGAYIVIEGPDNVGKSTLINELKELFVNTKYKPLFVGEPNTTEVGVGVRNLIKNVKMKPDAQFHLFHAARLDLMMNVILPETNKGSCVISDRNLHTSLAYQYTLGGYEPALTITGEANFRPANYTAWLLPSKEKYLEHIGPLASAEADGQDEIERRFTPENRHYAYEYLWDMMVMGVEEEYDFGTSNSKFSRYNERFTEIDAKGNAKAIFDRYVNDIIPAAEAGKINLVANYEETIRKLSEKITALEGEISKVMSEMNIIDVE